MSCRREIQTIRAALYVRGLLLSFGKFSTKIAIFIAIVSYAVLGNKITAEKVSLLSYVENKFSWLQCFFHTGKILFGNGGEHGFLTGTTSLLFLILLLQLQ